MSETKDTFWDDLQFDVPLDTSKTFLRQVGELTPEQREELKGVVAGSIRSAEKRKKAAEIMGKLLESVAVVAKAGVLA